jgi:hypothetical protein
MGVGLLGAVGVAALLCVLPLPAEAKSLGGCPTAGGYFAIEFDDIPELPAEAFASEDLNQDGTICAKFSPSPDEAPGSPRGILIDNRVRGVAA